MDSSEIYDYATKYGWLLVHEGDYVHVYERDITDYPRNYARSRKYIFVSLTSHGEYDSDGSRLVLPLTGEIFTLDDDPDATILCWWFDGNEGSEDDWWNQASEEERSTRP